MLLDVDENTVYRNRFRLRRLKQFVSIVDQVLREKPLCRVIDIGGNVEYWQGLRQLWSDRPIHITVVNLDGEPVEDPQFTVLIGNACDLGQFQDNSFDIVHSNSVIEHVGSFADQRRMAEEVRRLAPRHFVQTPNFWFPLEPHFRALFIHWLPDPWRRAIVMRRGCGFYPRAKSIDEAHRILQDARLLDRRAMGALFPDATIVAEQFGFLTKSLIAVR